MNIYWYKKCINPYPLISGNRLIHKIIYRPDKPKVKTFITKAPVLEFMSSKSRKNLVYFKLYFLGDTSSLSCHDFLAKSFIRIPAFLSPVMIFWPRASCVFQPFLSCHDFLAQTFMTTPTFLSPVMISWPRVSYVTLHLAILSWFLSRHREKILFLDINPLTS